MKFTISIILAFVFLHVHAQVIIRNMSLVKPDSNILIQYQDNMIKVSGTNQKTHIISKNGLTISTYDSNTFIIKPKTLKPDILMVYAGKELLLKKIFTIDTIPDPIIQLGYIMHDTATIQEIIANKLLIAMYKGSLLNDPIQVLRFSTTFIGPNKDMLNIFIPIQGNKLSMEQVAIIKQLEKNSKILFDDIIIATTSNPKERRLAPFAITIR